MKKEFKKGLTSFIIRTKNEQKWIGTVLQKIKEQTVQDFEIIIVDSGSTDRTLEIVKEYNIKIIHIRPEEFNYSYALNIGINEAKGEFIAILSGHSVPKTNTWLEEGLSNFIDPSIVGVGGVYNSLPDGGVFEKLGDFLDYMNPLRNRRWQYCKNLSNTNSIIRKTAWELYNFDESLLQGCEDYDWSSEMIIRGFNVITDRRIDVYHSHGGLNRPQYIFRVNEWSKVMGEIDKIERPRKSYSRLKI